MIEHIHIEQLIRDLCPNGVEYTTLGALGSFENTGVDKKIVPGEQEITLLNYVDVFNHRYIDASIPSMRVTASDKKIVQCNVLKDDIFVTPSSETRDEIGRAAVILEDLEDTVYSYHIMRYRLHSPNTITAKYIRYLFDTSLIQDQVAQNAQGLTRFGVSKFQFAAFSIPFPPFAVQEEIVRILDTFDNLITNIDNEIALRQEQLNEVRTVSLSEAKHRWSLEKLGNVCQIKTGKLNANAQVEDGKYPFFTCDAKPYRIDTFAFDTEAILISGNGSKVGHLNYYKGKFNAYQRTYVLDKFNTVDIFYMLHYMKGTLRSYIVERSKKGSVPYITLPMLTDFEFPLPPLSEQRAIAEKLDTIEAFINNLKTERDLRQQQYEYYREHLINLLK